MFPLITARVTLPPKMSDDHAGLTKAQEKIGTLIGNLVVAKKTLHLGAIKKIKDTLKTFTQCMLDHFHEEEEVGLIMLRLCMTWKEYIPTRRAIAKRMSAKEMGWVLHAMPDTAARHYFMTSVCGMPGFIQKWLMYPALKRYSNNITRLLLEVEAGERIPLEPSGCFAQP